jgi:hypothetical protein
MSLTRAVLQVGSCCCEVIAYLPSFGLKPQIDQGLDFTRHGWGVRDTGFDGLGMT